VTLRPSRLLVSAVAATGLVTVLASCSSGTSTATPTASASISLAAAPGDCSPENLTTRSGGTLTIAVPEHVDEPYFVGEDPTKPHGDPASGEGFESALIAELATRLGFTTAQITWIPFAKDYASSLDEVDVAIGRIPANPRDGVDFTTSYGATRAMLVTRDGTDLALVRTVPEALRRPIGTVGDATTRTLLAELDVPLDKVSTYRSLDSAIAALEVGRVEGLVLDAGTAGYVAQQVPVTHVTAAWSKQQAELALALRTGDPLAVCVNEALADMAQDGTLGTLTGTWLTDIDAKPLKDA